MERDKNISIQESYNEANPSTGVSIINNSLLSKTKSEIISEYRDKARNLCDVKDPVTIGVLIKKQILGLTEAYSIVSEQMMDRNLIGKEGIENHSAKIITKEVGIKYDYSVCNDDEWNVINTRIEQLTEQRKERELFLKSIKQPIGVS